MGKSWSGPELEQALRRAVNRSVPDVYEQVSRQSPPPLLNGDGVVPSQSPGRRGFAWVALLVLLALIGGGAWWLLGRNAPVTLEEAKAIALEYAGVSAGEASFTKVELERDKFRQVYELRFSTIQAEYECEVDRRTGEIHKLETRPLAGPPPEPADQLLTAAQAEEIALAHAGAAAEQVREKKTKRESEDGQTYYKVEFEAGSMEYEYKIDAYTGAILEMEWDEED